jgi:hypothetical protein
MKKERLLLALCLISLAAPLAKHARAQAAPRVFADASHPAAPPDPEKLAQV